MTDKYIALVSGVEREVAGTVTGGTNAQAGKITALDGTGRLDSSIMPVGVAPDVDIANAFETLTAATPFVYKRSDGTYANASAAVGGNAALGFILSNVATGQPATVFFEGRVTGLTGLTPGARYYLSDATPGGLTSTPVDNTVAGSAGKLHQYLGRAISATTLSFEADDFVVLAAP